MRANWMKGCLAMAAGAMGCVGAQAVDITIFDNMGDSETFGVADARGLFEDNETEDNTVNNQSWDLEMFDLTGSTLSIVGGWDFVNGSAHSHGDGGDFANLFESGDVFLSLGDTTPLYGDAVGNVQSGNGFFSIPNSFGYNYVIDVNWKDATASHIDYHIYQLSNEALLSVYYNQNEASNPFRLILPDPSPTLLFSGATGMTTHADGYLGLTGGTHNQVSFDISSILAQASGGDVLYTHFTQECGNDLLMGRTTVPDGGAMALMLGITLIVIGRVRRRLT